MARCSWAPATASSNGFGVLRLMVPTMNLTRFRPGASTLIVNSCMTSMLMRASAHLKHHRCLPLLRRGKDLGVVPADHDATREFAEVIHPTHVCGSGFDFPA